MSEIKRMKALVTLLSKASKAYYQENREIMSNLEYDQLYDELMALEEKNGLVLTGSPTRQVGYEIVGALPKEAHNSKMLSLDKTKSREDLLAWLGDHKGLLSWKLDGITLVLTYEDGVLTKGVTRGNGIIGEVITNNVRVFDNVPLKINIKGTLVVRGEAVIKYSDFENINLYKEFQVSPQGEFLDLNINSEVTRPGHNDERFWNSGFIVKSRIDSLNMFWHAEIRIPLAAIDNRKPEAGNELRVNVYRLQGPSETRDFLAWRPTGIWNPHRPSMFGMLRLTD